MTNEDGCRPFAINQRTVARWSALQTIDACARHGVEAVGLWREPVAKDGIDEVTRALRRTGLRVSSLCRGGFFVTSSAATRAVTMADNRRAVEEAATLGAACLVLVVGGLPPGSRDLPAARSQVSDAVTELAGYAQRHGVRLALEPMHPMYCADRGVVSTLAQALDLAEAFGPDVVGVVVDTYHVWWDPDLMAQIARAGHRIASFQVSDWITPLPADTLLARGMMGDGHIDFAPIRAAVDAAGYRGDVEVEIFNAELWADDADDVLTTCRRRYLEHVARDPELQ